MSGGRKTNFNLINISVAFENNLPQHTYSTMSGQTASTSKINTLFWNSNSISGFENNHNKRFPKHKEGSRNISTSGTLVPAYERYLQTIYKKAVEIDISQIFTS